MMSMYDIFFLLFHFMFFKHSFLHIKNRKYYIFLNKPLFTPGITTPVSWVCLEHLNSRTARVEPTTRSAAVDRLVTMST